MKNIIPHKLINNIKCKQCSKCKIYKELNQFNTYNATWDKLYPSCKGCKKLSIKPSKKQLCNKTIDNIKYRLCRECNSWQKLSDFKINHKCILYTCKLCSSKYNHKYWSEHIDILRLKNSYYWDNNKDRLYDKHKEWVNNHKKSIYEYGKEYRKINKQKLQDYDRRKHHKYKNNINYRITKNMRRRVLAALKGHPKISTTMNLVGCNINTLKEHLEKQFTDNMSWNNYGDWHIDHIIPCNSFNLSIESEQKKCFNYTNLQPLWAIDNCKKGAKQ